MNELLISTWIRTAAALRGVAHRLGDERAQGTVEYVGLILLGLDADGRHGGRDEGLQRHLGTEIAEVIISKIKQAVNAITFK